MENYSYNSSYPESGGSSPRSREIDFENPPPWEDSQGNTANYKVKFMCSYGGKIHPRPHDNQLSYIGGETKILAVDRGIKFASLLTKLMALCDSDNISFKYQLPGEDLDALISVTSDDDLEHMMHEYERVYRISPKPTRLRIFIFMNQSLNQSLNSSTRSFGSDEAKSEKERFVEALNSAPIMTAPPQAAPPAAVVASQPQPPPNHVDYLFGLEKANAMATPQPPIQGRVADVEAPVVVPGLDERLMGMDPIQKHIQDLQRLRLEEQQQQQGIYRRKTEDNIPGVMAGGEYHRVQDKLPQVTVTGGYPYWTDKQVPGGVFPATTVNNEQQVFMIPTQAGAYHTPMVRPTPGAPNQGFYTVQRMPQEVYREQQQMYNMISQGAMASMAAPPPQQNLGPQKAAAGYSEGYGMVRTATTGGVMTEAGYAQMAYDNAVGRQVIYAAPGGVMGAPVTYQGVVGGTSADVRVGGALNPETGGKGIGKVTQTSV